VRRVKCGERSDETTIILIAFATHNKSEATNVANYNLTALTIRKLPTPRPNDIH